MCIFSEPPRSWLHLILSCVLGVRISSVLFSYGTVDVQWVYAKVINSVLFRFVSCLQIIIKMDLLRWKAFNTPARLVRAFILKLALYVINILSLGSVFWQANKFLIVFNVKEIVVRWNIRGVRGCLYSSDTFTTIWFSHFILFVTQTAKYFFLNVTGAKTSSVLAGDFVFNDNQWRMFI